MRALDTDEVKVIPGTSGAGYPFWAPDSRRVGFFGSGHLNTVDVAGGGPVVPVCAASNGKGGSLGRRRPHPLHADPRLAPHDRAGGRRRPDAGDRRRTRTRTSAPTASPAGCPTASHFLYLAWHRSTRRADQRHRRRPARGRGGRRHGPGADAGADGCPLRRRARLLRPRGQPHGPALRPGQAGLHRAAAPAGRRRADPGRGPLRGVHPGRRRAGLLRGRGRVHGGGQAGLGRGRDRDRVVDQAGSPGWLRRSRPKAAASPCPGSTSSRGPTTSGSTTWTGAWPRA